MLFMIVERFKDQDPVPVYAHLDKVGRRLPDGLVYHASWIEPNFDRCFQLMECDDASLLQQWILSWRGAGVSFEIVPVVPSAQTRAIVAPLLKSAAQPKAASRGALRARPRRRTRPD
jgi:hypothetical protein